MNQETGIFIYPPEPLDENQIRVIDIQPGTGDSVIRCQLVVLWREWNHPYQALSYAWGNIARTHFILVDDKKFWLHQNLYEALQFIRDKELTIRLWTDRISINQENVPERNSQVRNMGKTYVEAEEVLIWLGASLPDFYNLKDLQDLIEHHFELTGREWMEKWPIVRDVLSRPWFERLWVIQEAALAQKGTVLVGHQRIDLQVLLHLYDIDLGRMGYMTANDDLDLSFGDVGTAIDALATMSRLRDMVAEPRSTTNQATIMYLCRGQHCHDPRDFIFATTGLADHMSIARQEVDYSLTVEEVFLRFAKGELLRDANEILYCDASAMHLDVPSWVPDWSIRPDSAALCVSMFSSGGVTGTAQFLEDAFQYDSRVLRLSGFNLDVVSESHSHGKEEGWTPKKLRKIEGDCLPKFRQSHPYGNYLNQLQAFWRTVIANTCKQSWPAEIDFSEWPSNDPGVAYEVYVGRAEPVKSHGSGNARWESKEAFTQVFADSLVTASDGRDIFFTTAGYIGLGPSAMQRKDHIVVSPGLTMPIALRPRSDSDRYQLLGAVYVHGIMKGEFVRTLHENGAPVGHTTFQID